MRSQAYCENNQAISGRQHDIGEHSVRGDASNEVAGTEDIPGLRLDGQILMPEIMGRF